MLPIVSLLQAALLLAANGSIEAEVAAGPYEVSGVAFVSGDAQLFVGTPEGRHEFFFGCDAGYSYTPF